MPKIHQKIQHHFPGAYALGSREDVPFRINVCRIEPSIDDLGDPIHHHETRVTFFCVIEGIMKIEVSGHLIEVEEGSMLEVQPHEYYRTMGAGSVGALYVVVGSHNEDDRILVE